MESDPQVGQLRRRTLLETVATYRVLAVEGPQVTVEAIDVPGLVAGHQLRLTTESVAAMELLDPTAAPTAERPSPSLGQGAIPRTA